MRRECVLYFTGMRQRLVEVTEMGNCIVPRKRSIAVFLLPACLPVCFASWLFFFFLLHDTLF